jgi:hypothetical protein
MRLLKITGTLIGVIILSGLLFLVVSTVIASPYLKFMAEDSAYYSQIADACDLIIAQHPARATDSVTLSPHVVLVNTIKLSGRDAPKIIRALHADTILVSKNHVAIEIPPEKWADLFIDATTTMQQVFAQVGPPDGDVGSGIYIFVYRLSDGSSIFIGSADPSHVMYVDHGTNLPDGTTSPDYSEQLYPKK